jgi:hypothetical protein
MGQSSLVVHSFHNSLAYSTAASDEPFWDAVYRKAFPSMVNHMLCNSDCQAQRDGIDRVIVLANGVVLKIDEKKRTGEWNDILLEYISVDRTNAPGWIEKDLTIDYLAYAFMKSQRVYIFPWLFLRRAWNHYKKEWIETYKRIEANNGTYKTISVAVPIDTVKKAVSTAMSIQL